MFKNSLFQVAEGSHLPDETVSKYMKEKESERERKGRRKKGRKEKRHVSTT